LGTCSDADYTYAAGEKSYSVTWPTPTTVDFSLFKRSEVVVSAAEPHSIYAIGRPVPGECGQVALSQEFSNKANTNALSASVEHPMCSVWGIAGCGAAVAAAGAACGGPLDPADSVCILTALAAIPGCGPCLCSTVGCPSWCPCDGSDAPTDDSRSFRLGTCSDADYTYAAGEKSYSVTWPTPTTVDFSLFKHGRVSEVLV